jgi:hypothetical protein
MSIQIRDGTSYVGTAFMQVQNITAATIIQKVIDALQSREYIDMDRLQVIIKYSRGRRGGGSKKVTAISLDAWVKKKKAIVYIKSDNEDCFFQCIALALDEFENGVIEKRQPWRVAEAKKLRGDYEGAVDIQDLRDFEERFEMNIYVIYGYSREYLWESQHNYDRKCFMFFIDNEDGSGHYHYIRPKRVGQIWEHSHFCFSCMKGYKDISHRCIKKCTACYTQECEGNGLHVAEMTMTCDRCNMEVYDAKCLETHVLSRCNQRNQVKCKECKVVVTRKKFKDHQCGKIQCTNCEEYFPRFDNHECYHKTLDCLNEPSEKYIFYDYECYLENGEHHVALVVAMTMEDPTPVVFDDHDEFIKWLFKKEHRGYTCIAHNGGRYDFHFIKKEMLNRGIKSSDVTNGQTIFYSYCRDFDLRFVDSWRFISTSLRNFPKTFGITEMAKGHFPYTFFNKETENYVGPMPGLEHFSFNSQSPDQRKEALEWHAEHKDDIINLKQMCTEYCISDVALLREGCIKFRELFMSLSNDEMDPFQYITIASVCINLYKRFYMPEETIGVFPVELDNIDREEWLASLRIPGKRLYDSAFDFQAVDGTLYAFKYCLERGCPKCLNKFSVHPTKQVFMHELLYEWRQEVASVDVPVVEIWQCEWEKTKDEDLGCVVDEAHVPLNIRDSFFGGRTEPIKLWKKCEGNEKIRYLDYTSLYPSVQWGEHRPITDDGEAKVLKYPVGHFIRITDDFEPLENYFGFVKCHVTPPQDLYMPVLPEKKNGKLMFDLCPRIGTWSTVEVLKAIEMGYVVDEIYEVVHFPNTSEDLFKEYVKAFLKVKQEAAGWKKLGCRTEDEKQEYIQRYSREQGIDLDYFKIGEYNPGLYFIAKLCLNSLWGKFAQRGVFMETADVFSQKEFEYYAHNDRYEVSSVFMHGSRARTIAFKKRRIYDELPKNTNIAIASYTTAYARLRLYEALEAVGENVLYMDTDSVIFVDNGNCPLKCGDFLGDLTDELSDGEWIVEFVCTGPKCYAYRTNKGKTEIKIKGFSLNYETLQVLNFDVLAMMVKEVRDMEVVTKPMQFDISADHSIHTKQWDEEDGKVFRLTFDKRKVCWNDDGAEINTVPHKKICLP